MDIYQHMSQVLAAELGRQKGIDLPERYGEWIDMDALVRAAADLIIDLAGTGRLLASIDRVARPSARSASEDYQAE